LGFLQNLAWIRYRLSKAVIEAWGVITSGDSSVTGDMDGQPDCQQKNAGCYGGSVTFLARCGEAGALEIRVGSEVLSELS
jgi:hypothetical protein